MSWQFLLYSLRARDVAVLSLFVGGIGMTGISMWNFHREEQGKQVNHTTARAEQPDKPLVYTGVTK